MGFKNDTSYIIYRDGLIYGYKRKKTIYKELIYTVRWIKWILMSFQTYRIVFSIPFIVKYGEWLKAQQMENGLNLLM